MNIRLLAKRDDEKSHHFVSGKIFHGFEFSPDLFCDTTRELSNLMKALTDGKSSFRKTSVLEILKRLGFSIEISVKDHDIYAFLEYMRAENLQYKTLSRMHYSTIEI